MSLATLLLAFLPAIVRPNPEREKSKREVELEHELERMLERCEELTAERDSARRQLREARDMLDRMALARIDERLDREETRQRAVYQQLAAAQYQQGLAQAAGDGLAQYQAQQAMNAQMLGMLGNPLGQLGAFGEICNCVPARHDVLRLGLGLGG